MALRRLREDRSFARPRRGLTLVETIIATGLLALLAAVCVPALSPSPRPPNAAALAWNEPDLADTAQEILAKPRSEQTFDGFAARGIDGLWIPSSDGDGEWLVLQRGDAVVIRWQRINAGAMR